MEAINCRSMPRTLVALLLTLLGLSVCALGDDGNVTGESGAVELLAGSKTTVRMVSEIVRIDRLPEGRVRARFVFRNEGPATTVMMGFPASATGADTSANEAKLGHFRSWVDGHEVKTRWVLGKTEEQDYPAWYVKKVRFARGQTRIVEDSYTGGGGNTSNGFLSFGYVLSTGGSWKGKIDRAQIRLELGPLANYSPLQIGGHWHRNGDTVSWDLKSIKPDTKDDINIQWYPSFRNVYIDGTPAGQGVKGQAWRPGYQFLFIGLPHEPEPVYACNRRGTRFDIPIDLATEWLHGKFTVGKNGSVRIGLGQRWADARIGSRLLHTSSGEVVRMDRPARLGPTPQGAEGELYIVELRALVQALGGQTHLSGAADRLDINLPKQTQAP